MKSEEGKVNEMKYIKNCVFPIVLFLLIAWIGKGIYMVDGQIDWFRACLCFGLPFGITHMLFVFPIGGSISTGVGILVINMIVGAMLGVFIMAFALMRAVWTVITIPFGGLH